MRHQGYQTAMQRPLLWGWSLWINEEPVTKWLGFATCGHKRVTPVSINPQMAMAIGP